MFDAAHKGTLLSSVVMQSRAVVLAGRAKSVYLLEALYVFFLQACCCFSYADTIPSLETTLTERSGITVDLVQWNICQQDSSSPVC